MNIFRWIFDRRTATHRQIGKLFVRLDRKVDVGEFDMFKKSVFNQLGALKNEQEIASSKTNLICNKVSAKDVDAFDAGGEKAIISMLGKKKCIVHKKRKAAAK